jgi:hypothetical protein
MQTFLPYPDFKKSAQCLDRARLGKQRVECLTILNGKWRNHPVSKMWVGHEYQLAEYGKAICLEWISRGYKDTCLEKISNLQKRFVDTGLPSWYGDDDFHVAHQSNLLRKNRSHYEKFFSVKDDLPYIYPR